ncbi:nucleolar protein 12-domain-containing protein [Astrocystis sublimbata]|nr:nucleolar protein 12-domain-containing protein [Astrocystis sublimbata]
MFARPRPKKLPVAPSKKRKRNHAIEEIKFDNDARVEYLSGFHKRKVQRIKHAQEQAAKQAREDRIASRKQIRDDRKREVEEHVQNVHTALKQAAEAGYIDVEGEGNGGSDDDSAKEWGGIQDEPVDHEEEYIDEDRYTTVTVESVSVSKDGLTSSRPDDEDSEEGPDVADGDGDKKHDEVQAETRHGKDRHATKKKKKFRYETKLERQITNIKQKAKNNKRRSKD